MHHHNIMRNGHGLFRGLVLALALVGTSGGPAVAVPLGNANPAVTGNMIAEPGENATETKPVPAGVLPPMNGNERQGYGCLVGGGTALALTALAGPTETVLIVAGGSLIPTNSVLLWTALTSTVVASVCAASALVAPVAVRLWDYYYLGMRPAPETAAEIATAAE